MGVYGATKEDTSAVRSRISNKSASLGDNFHFSMRSARPRKGLTQELLGLFCCNQRRRSSNAFHAASLRALSLIALISFNPVCQPASSTRTKYWFNVWCPSERTEFASSRYPSGQGI